MSGLIVQEDVSVDPKGPVDKGEIRRGLIALALPSMGEYILKMMVGAVDTAFVGRLGAEQLAVSGLSWMLLFFCTMPLFGMNTGLSAIVARHWGAKRFKEAGRVAGQALILNMIAGVLVTVVLIVFAPKLLKILGASPYVVETGSRFLRIISSSFIFSVMMFASHAILKASGDTKTPMFVIGFVNVLNIGLDYCLIYGKFGFPEHGVIGVAEASALVRVIGAVISFGGLFLRFFRIYVTPEDFARIDLGIMKSVIRIGGPSMIEYAFFSTAMTAFTWIMIRLGTDALATHNVMIQAESFSFMPGIGFSTATGILAGQSLGANRPDKARATGLEGAKMGAVLMGTIGLIFILFPEFIIRIFTDSPAVLDIGTHTLRVIGMVQPLQGMMFCLYGALRGAGDTKTTMKISLAGLWLVRVPVAYLLGVTLGAGVAGVYGGMCMDIAFKGWILLLRFRQKGWEEIKV